MIRTRFAPSPTGHLHVGGARTAILNWLVARHAGDVFVLRIEDTDTDRNQAGAEAEIFADLRWLGLDWDEGPEVGGPYGPYRQSERGAIYREHAERLLDAGLAYRCTCPPSPGETTGEARARCDCADTERSAETPGASIRFRAPDAGEVRVDDLIRGEVVFPADSIEDFVLLRSDGRPTYNFAAAVDDATMRITHVIRGSDHLVNTPKQILLYHAFGWALPAFAHVPLILGEDRQKLSKRHGATSVAEHRRAGYLPEALFNYLSLLAWSSPSGEEFLPRERLVAEMDLDRVGASDAVFDPEKLRWLSGQYLHQLPVDDLVRRVRGFVDLEQVQIEESALPVAIADIQTRFALLTEANEELAAFAGPRTPEQREARSAALADAEARRVLAAVRDHLQGLSDWSTEAINDGIRAAGKEAGAKGKALFQPLRRALTGEDHGIELPKIIHVLGRDRALALLEPETSV